MTIKRFHNGVLKLSATDTAFITSNPINTTGSPGMAYRFTVGFPPFYPQQVFEEWGAGNITTTSISNNVVHNNFFIYPNPAQNSFTVQLYSANNFDLLITDALGRKVCEQKNISGKTQIDSKDFTSGIYFVNVTTAADLIYNQKIIINK